MNLTISRSLTRPLTLQARSKKMINLYFDKKNIALADKENVKILPDLAPFLYFMVAIDRPHYIT